MSIKSDNWIRRMARDHGMIEPFAPEQVRQVNGHKIVSYGTSSYGYDVRCANEFKIFTNINSTIVDPKTFDEKSFVDFGGDVCIIPPNSFALARTVEYFRIPRSVLTICLGKCVTADTRVVDADTRRAAADHGDALRARRPSAWMAGHSSRRRSPPSCRRAGSRYSSCAPAPGCASVRPRTTRSACCRAGRRSRTCRPGDRIAVAREHPGVRQDGASRTGRRACSG